MYLSKAEAALLPPPLPTARTGRRKLVPLLGPAFVAAVAYVDPGNVATNFSAGAASGYTLLRVVVAAGLVGVLVQTLTAKLGLATGRDLASLCRERLPRPVTWGLWLQAEAVAVATDLAEIVGGAVALRLLLGVPLPVGGVITAVVAFALLAPQSRGHRPFERVIAGLLLVVGLGFGWTLVGSGIDVGGAVARSCRRRNRPYTGVRSHGACPMQVDRPAGTPWPAPRRWGRRRYRWVPGASTTSSSGCGRAAR